MHNNPPNDSTTIFLAVTLTLLLVGCTPQVRYDANVQPGWVTGASEKYPAARYFVGKGNASALDVAAKKARGALLDSMPEPVGNMPSAVLDELVQQAEVVDAWQDTNTRQHYALVVLAHTAAARVLREQLSELDANTRQFIKAATQGTDPLQQIQFMHNALATQQTRTDLLLALQTLGVETSKDPGVWSIIEMQTHLKSLLSSIDVAPRTNGDSQLASAVVRGLDAAGYLSKRAQAHYVLNASLQRSGMKWEQGRFVEQGTLRVELLNQQQKVVGKAQWPLKAQAEQRLMLDKEMMREVANTLHKQLAEKVLGLTAK